MKSFVRDNRSIPLLELAQHHMKFKKVFVQIDKFIYKNLKKNKCVNLDKYFFEFVLGGRQTQAKGLTCCPAQSFSSTKWEQLHSPDSQKEVAKKHQKVHAIKYCSFLRLSEIISN